MATWENDLKKAIGKAKGSFGAIRSALTSSNVTTTLQNFCNAATGRVRIVDIIFQTDATGLAGGTNFQIKRTGTYGLANVMIESVANLGGNKTVSGAATATGGQPSVADNLPCVLEGGDVLQYNCTAANCTGAGIVVVTVIYQRIDDNAEITAVNA